MKKKILILVAAVLSLTAAVSGTLAYFNDSVTAHNVITTGGVSIELIENTKNDNGAAIIWPKQGLNGIMPGTSASKIVSVRNNGQADAWIRVGVDIAISESGDPITNPTIKCLPLTITVDGRDVDVVSYSVDGDKWLRGGDGYYYYKTPVAANSSTENLFEEVIFAKEMGNEYQNCTVYIDVTAQAVQAANNAIPEGGDVTGVQGWPNE
ncbi:MAG: hypothetical protein IJE29_06080 [Firmicutes bacterium]|nr:hypothetical protein [Bacillota bacterium]